MFERKIINYEYFRSIFGEIPDFGNIEVSSIELNRDGSSFFVTILTDQIPKSPPKKWIEFNAVYIKLQFFPILKISISKFESSGYSKISILDSASNFAMKISGSVNLELISEYVRIESIKEYTRDNSDSNL
jgi:Immunity protein 50